MEYTHKQLVQIAYRWVLKNASCGVAFKELVTLSSQEIPDVIGFGAWEHSVLIECKISRSDFLCDKKKPFRSTPELGMGIQRFYCVPSGMIKKEELPEGWGLIYVGERKSCTCVYNPYKEALQQRRVLKFERNVKAELGIMYSALRRLHIRGRIEEIYPPDMSLENKLFLNEQAVNHQGTEPRTERRNDAKSE